MKCTVTIDNKKGEIFSSSGELNFGAEGFGLFYEIDGDKCLLTYSNGRIIQDRRGSVPMRMVFSLGEKTTCTLGDKNMHGSFEVFTDKIHIENDAKSVSILLNYTCAGENITLNITAK